MNLGKFPTNTISEGKTVAGSEHTADLIAAGLRGDTTDECAQELIDSGLVQAVDFTTGAIALASVIE